MADAGSPNAGGAETGAPGARTVGKRAITFIFLTVLIDVIGFGMIIPVVPDLIMELIGAGISEAVLYQGWLLFVFALMNFFFAPILGNLSDRFGRRPVLLLSLFVLGLDYLLMGVAPTIGWLFLGRMIAGITGATYATANAFIADVSAPADRAKNFGLTGAAFGLGFVLGPALGGILGELGPRVPFFAAAGLALANVTFGYFVLPETLPKENRRPFSLARANPLGALAQIRPYPIVMGLLSVVVLFQFAHDANPATWSFYGVLKFGWTRLEIGMSLAVLGILVATVQGLVIRVVMPRLGEERAAYIGFSLLAVGFLGFAFATETWWMFVSMIPFALGGIAMPAIRGILSNQVPDNAQGELQGAMGSLQALTAIVAPLMMTRLFGFFTADEAPLYFPGAAFFVAAVLVLGCALAAARVMRSSQFSLEPFSQLNPAEAPGADKVGGLSEDAA